MKLNAKMLYKTIPGISPRRNDIQNDITETLHTVKELLVGVSILYGIGLCCASWHHSVLGIRTVELFRAQYIFTGLYCSVFFFLHLYLVFKFTKKWAIWLPTLAVLLVVCITTKHVMNGLVFNSEGYTTSQISILHGELALKLILFVGAFFFLFMYKILVSEISEHRYWPITVLLMSIICSFSLFYQSIFLRIPQAAGGGKAPIVEVFMLDDTPYEVRMGLDVSPHIKWISQPTYKAHLVYSNSDSVFLGDTAWYSHSIFEVDRSFISAIEYRDCVNWLDKGNEDATK